MERPDKHVIGVIGLGYVGLPLAIELDKFFDVVGFDINERRIEALTENTDATGEVTEQELVASNIEFTAQAEMLKHCMVFIITVPTPVDDAKTPDLSYMMNATKIVAPFLAENKTVIYESTVYPGCIEEEMIPLIEKMTGLNCDSELHVGYSPERINPGDKNRKLPEITKVISANTAEGLNILEEIYSRIIPAGIFKASSIKVAEAAKVIENTQRDLNIAFMNELSIVFHAMNISIKDVLAAAKTKWNFIDFEPGLVGGHCIGVDPYYLSYKAKKLGIAPRIIESGRSTNDKMHEFFATKFLQQLIKRTESRKVLIMGCTFKENCPDLRNSKVFDFARYLENFGCEVSILDPVVDAESRGRRGILNTVAGKYGGIVLAVPHECLLVDINNILSQHLEGDGVFYDLKGKASVPSSLAPY